MTFIALLNLAAGKTLVTLCPLKKLEPEMVKNKYIHGQINGYIWYSRKADPF